MDEQQLQQQIVQLVQAAMQGDQQAAQQIQQIMQAAQQGDPQAAQIAQMILAVAQLMQQQQVRAAKFGAKLNYIKQLNGQCPDGYEMQYFKTGGKVCKKCVKKAMGGSSAQNFAKSASKLPREIQELQKPRFDLPINIDMSKYDKYFPKKPRNVVDGSVLTGKENFNPNTTTIPHPSSNIFNRILSFGEYSNDERLPAFDRKSLLGYKCGGKTKLKKKACGGSVEKNKCGNTIKKKK